MAALPGRAGIDRITGEQAALRRVATLVAGAAAPEEVFTAVAEEAGRLLGANYITMARYDPDGARTVIASWSSAGAAFPVGSRARLGGHNVATLVFQTGQAARIDDYSGASGPVAAAGRKFGLAAAVGVPVSVEGGLWGVMVVGSRREPLPPDTEAQLAGFTELAATAIANAQARMELRGFAAEQAALRRVATLVAGAAAPGELFAAVTEEAGRLLGTDYTTMARYDPDGARTVIASWSSAGAATFRVGDQARLGGHNVPTLVFQTGRAARIDDYSQTVSGPVAEASHEYGFCAAVGVPVRVEGRLWGVMAVGSSAGPLPAGTEARLAGFTELAATAIANAQARVELRGFAEEQAALRRVATLVAGAAPPEQVFASVSEEAGQLLGASYTVMARYDPDGARTVVAAWSRTGAAFPVGSQTRLGGHNVPTLVFQTGRAARIDEHHDASGPIGEVAREFGIRATVGVPVSVEGRLWGVMMVASRAEPLPAETEARLAGFTELAATAIANAQARVELRGFAEEQAALQRVATLVAGPAPPEQVLTAVTEEAGQLLHADYATMNRYSPDGTITVVAAWSSSGATFRVGAEARLGGRNLQTMIFQTRRPARIDDLAWATGPIADLAREFGLRAAVGVPVSVEGRLWGVMVVGSRAEPLPAGTETHLAAFTELAATAIANTEAQAALTASRARIVATADSTRRRIERNLHDGAQQHLVSLALDLRAARTAAPEGSGDLAQQLDHLATGVNGVLEELREIARGLHPAILADGGLRPAIKTLARRSAVPVHVDIQVDGRLPEPVETAAYYTVAEALTNTAKHARATTVRIEVAESDGVLRVRVRDNGRGGADFSDGSGLVGLKDRAEALGGSLRLNSPPGAGTTVEIDLPIDDPGGPELTPRSSEPPITEAGCAG
jgi:GAF domain-containing protein